MHVRAALVSGVFAAAALALLDRGLRSKSAKEPRAGRRLLGGCLVNALYLAPMAYVRRAWLPRAIIHGAFAGLVVGRKNPPARTASIALHTIGAIATIAVGWTLDGSRR